MMALRHAEQTGEGQVVDVSLIESVLAVTESLVPEYGVDGTVRERTGSSLPGIAPSNTYLTQDGRYLVLAANGDSIFQRLMHAIGRPDVANDERFKHNDGRAAASDELDEILGAWSASVSLSRALDVLEQASVPASGINSIAEVFEDQQFKARGSIEHHTLKSGLNLSMPSAVPRLTKTPGGTQWLGPRLGEHNREVLEALGLDDEMIRKVTGG
jgi:formyl-CoA transferase